jgi:hypothetical protein
MVTGAASEASGSFAGSVREVLRQARTQPAYGLYLLALAALGFKWLSPISSVQEHGGWSDVLVAAAALAWLIDRVRTGTFPRPRAFHFLLLAFVALTLISALFAEDHATAARNVLLATELAVLAFLSSEFASARERLNGMVFVVAALALLTGVLAVTGLGLFYLDVHTSLLSGYGDLAASDRYARVAAGFESAPLLASFCIFASAIVAQEGTPLPRWLRLLTQIVLSLLVIATLSRGVIAFFTAMAIRNAAGRPASVLAKRLAVGAVFGAVLLMASLTVGRLHIDPSRPSTASYEIRDPGPRRQTLVSGFETLADHPLVGKGPGSLVAESSGQPFRAHFTPLDVAATTGVPALLALTAIVVVLWRDRRRPTPVATWSGLLGLGIDGLGQDIEHFRHVWVLLGVADAQRAADDGDRQS